MNIISCDGGGLKGLLPLIKIKNILKEYPSFLDHADAYAGTSTGAIIALGLAHGVSINELINLYQNRAKDIFNDNIIDDVKDLFGLKGAQYNQNKLKEICWGLFGNYTLGDLKKKVLITSFCLDNKKEGIERSWKPAIFDNFDEKYANERLFELCLRTSAAPTFFPARIDPITKIPYMDGGVMCNNPSVCMLVEAYKAGYTDENIKLVSFGTGKFPKYIESNNYDFGLIQLAPYLIDIFMESVSQLSDYQSKQLIGDNYLRINPTTPKEYKLDGVSEVNEMIAFAETIPLSDNERNYIENIWLK